MKLVAVFLLFLFVFAACSDDDEGSIDPWYREAMRQFVINIRTAADSLTTGFILIPQNGHDIMQDTNGAPAAGYISAVDGAGQEDLFFGYDSDDVWTPVSARNEILGFLGTAQSNGVRVLVTDYVSTPAYVSMSQSSNDLLGFASFQAPDRELRVIPAAVNHQNAREITTLTEASNFLYLLNPENYATRTAYLTALSNAPHDLLIMDAFYNDMILSSSEVEYIRYKPGTGTRRLVVAYMSIGEAENYRYYWQPSWSGSPPSWLAGENPEWPGNYKVRYWEAGWQSIICNTTDSYLTRLIGSGFDGAYLDIIEAFEYFE